MKIAWSDPAGAVPVAGAIVLAILGACAETPPMTEEPGGAGRSELAIPHPKLDDMEPKVAAALIAQRSKVEALLESPQASTAEQARAIGHLGQLYQAHRLVEAAEASYREAHTRAPEVFDWAYYVGVLAARRGDLEEAVAAYEHALELRPSDLPALIRLADLELDLGEIDRAYTLYDRARSLDPSIAAVEYGLGRVAADRRSYLEAIEHFEEALALQPGASVIHYNLGQAYRQLGQLEQAELHLSQSGPVRVETPAPAARVFPELIRGSSPFLIQGNTALRDGRLSVAANAFRQAIEADPDDPKARQSLAQALTLLRDPKGALEQLEAAARLTPDNAQAQADLGTTLADQGQAERALEFLSKAVELEPELQQARFNLANTLARLGRVEQAESHYRHLLEIDPSHLMARSRLGTVLAQAGKLEQAISELREVVRQDPEDTPARLNLARVHFNLGTFKLRENDPLQALEHFQRALEHDDRLAPAHFNVANLLAGSGRLEEALGHFARVRELQPNHGDARLREATALMHQGRFSDARKALEEAVRLLPDEGSWTHALARLLAAAPEPSLRDGRRALDLMSGLLEHATSHSWVETQAMALAEVGRFQDAANQQRAVLAEARRRNREAETKRLARNLARYESELSCCANPEDVFPSR